VIRLLAPAKNGAFIDEKKPNFRQSTILYLGVYLKTTHLFFINITSQILAMTAIVTVMTILAPAASVSTCNAETHISAALNTK
jgi:hypothetical protein